MFVQSPEHVYTNDSWMLESSFMILTSSFWGQSSCSSSSFKASNRSSHFNLWISHTSHKKWWFQPWRNMELESKAWINYPQLLQEHSFKGYISDHNLSGLCFLHLLSDFTNTHTQREREYTHSTHRHTCMRCENIHFLSLMSSEKGVVIGLINHADESPHS